MRRLLLVCAFVFCGTLLTVAGCGGRDDAVVPAPTVAEDNGVPEGQDSDEYAKQMAEQMNN